MLRNMADLAASLKELNIPLVVRTVTPRKSVPQEVIKICQELGATHIYANIEYEVMLVA